VLVPPRDAGALAAAILDMLRDEARRRRMAEAGLARARTRFSVDRMVEETLAVYAAAAGTSRGAGTGRPRTAG
jgi:glycosyltransferase involved in cell wall biosynthesis